ncbi:MAG: sulfatase-like hydrolase/transferase [Verrucomicrobiales bacterium]|nr:sulfatase-like hydrolase/transferase [Verrucomicrobiales bacterium]
MREQGMSRLLIFLACFVLPSSLTAEDRPNILWLSAEDISAHIGCFGDPYAITPNLDALAEKGTRFTNTYTTAGVCAPCRSGIITGMYQNSIGTHHMRCDATLPEWLKPFPIYLREAGYYCTNNSKTDYQFSQPSAREIWDVSSSKAHWKNRPEGTPFFAVYNFTGCHESGIASKEKYESVTEGLSGTERQDPEVFENIPPYYPDTPTVREDWKRNYELITAMDQWAGRLIEEVKAAGEWENTIVMFWSDHGIGLPRAKRWLYDSGTRVPMILRLPEKWRELSPNEVDDRLVNSVDFGPTMLQLAGVEAPDYQHGVSFLRDGPKRDYVFGARDRMDERYDIIRAVRDKRFRYVRNFEPLKPYYQYMNTPEKGATMNEIRKAEKAGELTGALALFSAGTKPVEELYDLENDPHEIHNLADDPAHADKLAEMKAALFTWQLGIGDLGLIPESEIAVREAAAGSAYAILHGDTDQSVFIKELTSVATKASEGEDAFPDLLAALDHEDAAIRFWGATGLGNFADEAKELEGAVGKLKSALEDPSPTVRIAVGRALCRMGEVDPALQVVADEMRGKGEWARLEASIVLDELDEAARPVIESLQAGLSDQPNKYITRVSNKAVNDLLGTTNSVP